MTNERYRGKLIRVDKRGYGFISSEQIPFTRIFFHWLGLKQDTKKFPELKFGMWVEFETIMVQGKLRAIKIEVIPTPIREAKVEYLDTDKQDDI